MGILKNRISEVDQFGVGVMAFSDKSGGGVLQYNYAAVSVAYHKGLDEDGYHQIGAGFQGTYVNKRLEPASLHMEDQLRADGFTGISSENFSKFQLNLSYFDLNAGLFYNGTTNGDNNFYLGASMYHINQYRERFSDTGQYFLAARVTLQAGGRLPIGDGNSFHFSGNHSRQAGAVNTIIGGAYALNVAADEANPTNLYLGSWYRFGDAIIPYVGLEWGEFRLGASYDVNISSLKPGSNMRGGSEFSLIYTREPRDPNAKKLNCPKFWEIVFIRLLCAVSWQTKLQFFKCSLVDPDFLIPAFEALFIFGCVALLYYLLLIQHYHSTLFNPFYIVQDLIF